MLKKKKKIRLSERWSGRLTEEVNLYRNNAAFLFYVSFSFKHLNPVSFVKSNGQSQLKLQSQYQIYILFRVNCIFRPS